MSRWLLQDAFVLHRRDQGDSSLLLEAFAAEHGRLPLLAKGAKRARAPLAALLQPFQPLWLSWSGRGEVATLTAAEVAESPLSLSGERLYCGFYLNELLMRLLPRQEPQTTLFAAYRQALERLATGDPVEEALRQFELRLLGAIGYGVCLERLADDDAPVVAAGSYCYVPEAGLRRARDPREAGAISGATLLGLARGGPLSDTQRREARQLLRQVLAPYLGARPLHSRALFRRHAATTQTY